MSWISRTFTGLALWGIDGFPQNMEVSSTVDRERHMATANFLVTCDLLLLRVITRNKANRT